MYICVNLSAVCTVDSTATIARILPTQTHSQNLANTQFLCVHACQCLVISATGNLPYSNRSNNNCSSIATTSGAVLDNSSRRCHLKPVPAISSVAMLDNSSCCRHLRPVSAATSVAVLDNSSCCRCLTPVPAASVAIS